MLATRESEVLLMASDFGGGSAPRWGRRADVSICIFPHLQDFIVIDIRKGLPGRPLVRLLNTDHVLGEDFYQEVEGSFSQLLRQREQTFANLMALPGHVEGLVRERALKAILKTINEDAPEAGLPQMAIFLCTGPALHMDSTQLTRAIQRLFGQEIDAWVIMDTVEMMEKLLAREREMVRQEEREQIKQMIRGQSSEYFTLWESMS